MGATILTWPSTGGIPSGMTGGAGVAGTASANFPASAYYPVADSNAGNVTTDNAFRYLSTTGNVGSGGRVTGSVLAYSSQWNLGFAGLNLGNALCQAYGVDGHIAVVDGITSTASTLTGITFPASGLLLLVVVVPASGLQVHFAIRRLDTGQWLQTDASWNATFAYVLSPTLGGASIADGILTAAGQQNGGVFQIGSIRYLPAGTPAISPLTPTVMGSATQTFDFSGFDGGLVAWSKTLSGSSITPVGLYTAPATTGSVQSDTVTVNGLGNTGQSANTSVTIPSSVVSATMFSLSGPASGYVHNASSNFTFTPNGPFTGTITPTMSGLAGTWSPTSLSWSGTATAKTATFTPSASGSGTANGTASPTLTQPANVSYTSNPQTLGVTPGALPTSAITPEIFYGGGTFWLTTPPTFTPTGVAGVSCGTVSVISNTEAHAPITTGTATGTITWTDSTTGVTVTEPVAAVTYVLSIVQGLTPGLSTVGYAVYDESGSLLETWTASGVTERGAGSGNYGAVVAVPLGTYSEIRWSVSNAVPFAVDVVNAVTPSTGSGTAYYAF